MFSSCQFKYRFHKASWNISLVNTLIWFFFFLLVVRSSVNMFYSRWCLMQPSQWIYCFKSNDNHSDIYYKYHPTFQISYFNFAKKAKTSLNSRTWLYKKTYTHWNWKIWWTTSYWWSEIIALNSLIINNLMILIFFLLWSRKIE